MRYWRIRFYLMLISNLHKSPVACQCKRIWESEFDHFSVVVPFCSFRSFIHVFLLHLSFINLWRSKQFDSPALRQSKSWLVTRCVKREGDHRQIKKKYCCRLRANIDQTWLSNHYCKNETLCPLVSPYGHIATFTFIWD